MSYIFPKHVPHKLHMVTLVKTYLKRPHWERRILVKYGLTKNKRTVVLKNTAQVNADLKEIRELIEVRPVTLDTKPTVVEPEQGVFTDAEERRAELSNIHPDDVSDIDIVARPFLDTYGNFDATAYRDYVSAFPEDQLEEKLSRSHYPGSELLNQDFYMENEAKITDKGEKIELYFKKDTWKTPTQMRNRVFRRTKY